MRALSNIVSCLSLFAVLAGMSGCIGGETPEALPKVKEVKIKLVRPMDVAVDGMDRRIIANTGLNQVIVLDKNYEPVGSIRGLTKGGLLKEPYSVATDSKNRIIVADTGNNCVKIYDANGFYQKTIGSEGTGPKEFMRPKGVTTDEKDNIFVFDTGNKRVQVFSRSGKYLFSFSSGDYSYEVLKGISENPSVEKVEGSIVLDHPVRGTAMPGNRLVIADYHVGKYSVWEYDIREKTAKPIGFVEPQDNYPGYLAGDVAYNPAQNEMFYLRSGYSLDSINVMRVSGIDEAEYEKVPEEFQHLKDDPYEWEPFYETSGELKTRFLEPRGIAVDSEGNAVVALAKQNMVVEVTRYEIDERIDRFNPPAMRIADTDSDSFVIEYNTLRSIPTRFEYGQLNGQLVFGQAIDPEDFTEVYVDKKPKKRHRVEIVDLFPGTRYVYRFVASDRGFPKEGFSDTYLVSTAADRNKTLYLNMPVTVLLFTNIVEPCDVNTLPMDDEGNPIMPEDPGKVPNDEIARIMRELEMARVFYWVNSNFSLNVKLRYIFEETRYEDLPFEHGAYYSTEDRAKLDEILASHGIDPKAMNGGLCIIYGIRKYDAATGECIIPKSGGNTWASPYDSSGVSVWNMGGDNAWLFVQEFGRQLRIMANRCGQVYHSNHFHWNDLPDDYGEYWNGNAYIAREFKPSSYLALCYGEMTVSKDTDDDGIPDDDPNVPLDEKRFGSRAYSKDSDSDGLKDPEEILAAIWVFDYPTLDGQMVGPVYRPKGYDTDSDDDGISDGRDPYPLYPISTKVEKSIVTVDGVATEDEWAEGTMRLIEDEKANGSFHLNWDERYLYFGLSLEVGPDSTQPPEIEIQIDGNNDGFTVGSDNVTVDVGWDEEINDLVVTTIYNNTSIRGKPIWTSNINPKPEDVIVGWGRMGKHIFVELGVPQTPEAGLNLFAGEEIGFNFSFKPEGEELWLLLFEPQTLVDVTLE